MRFLRADDMEMVATLLRSTSFGDRCESIESKLKDDGWLDVVIGCGCSFIEYEGQEVVGIALAQKTVSSPFFVEKIAAKTEAIWLAMEVKLVDQIRLVGVRLATTTVDILDPDADRFLQAGWSKAAYYEEFSEEKQDLVHRWQMMRVFPDVKVRSEDWMVSR